MIKLSSLHNYFANAFTFHGGGSGGGSSTSQTGIDPILKPSVEYGAGEARRLYESNTPKYYEGQTYVSPSVATQTALQAAQNRAMAGNPLLPAAQQQQQDVISGKYLNSNPYFDASMRGAAQGATQNYFDAIKQAQGSTALAGRYGSNVSADIQNRAANTLSNTLANKYAETAYQNYNTERGRQEAAAAGAPTLANADYTDINQLLKVGQGQEGYQEKALNADINRFNWEQNLPYSKLNTFLQQIQGMPMGSVTQTTQSGGKIVCTMMNESYGTGSFRNKVWLAHSASMLHAKTYEKGYHTLFLPLVSFAKGKGFINRIVKRTLEHIAKHRTADVYKEMRNGKRDTLGRIYRAVLEPLCYVVGRMKGY